MRYIWNNFSEYLKKLILSNYLIVKTNDLLIDNICIKIVILIFLI